LCALPDRDDGHGPGRRSSESDESLTQGDLDTVLNALCIDHPELFQVARNQIAELEAVAASINKSKGS
jgi:hypothetical protein